jgi:hypothetical protein
MIWIGPIDGVLLLSIAAVILAMLLALSSVICWILGVRRSAILIALCAGVFLLVGMALFYIAMQMSAAV